MANGAVKEMTYPAVAGGARRVVRHELDSVGRTVKTCNGNCAVETMVVGRATSWSRSFDY